MPNGLVPLVLCEKYLLRQRGNAVLVSVYLLYSSIVQKQDCPWRKTHFPTATTKDYRRQWSRRTVQELIGSSTWGAMTKQIRSNAAGIDVERCDL